MANKVDKNQAIIDFLITCDKLKTNPLFFNFINAKDDNVEIITQSNDISIHTPYIDGSVERLYTFSLIYFKSVTSNPIVKISGIKNENIDDLLDVQGIIDWIEEQNENKIFPDFGDKCKVNTIQALSINPTLNGIDTSVNPPLAKYSIAIRVQYLDESKKIWNS